MVYTVLPGEAWEARSAVHIRFGGTVSKTYDVVVIGAGIVGLATAREVQQRHPQLAIAVVDKESGPGRHQSGHNSGVLHAGVYYKPGSLKAQLCVQGKTAMERFADEHGIGYETCGKLIVAVDESELGRLADLEQRGKANGVPGLRMVGPEELREIEPHAAGIRACLHNGSAAYAAKAIGWGFDLVTVSGDSRLLAQAAASSVGRFRELTGARPG